MEQGRPGTVRLHYCAERAVDNVVFGLGFIKPDGTSIAGPNSARDGAVDVPAGTGHIDFEMPQVLLADGRYEVSTSITADGRVIDFVDRSFEVSVRGSNSGEPGLVEHPGTFRFRPDA